MADRIFAAILLAATLGYAIIAFAVIRAPFQYDPLGPESWPQILSVTAVACLGGVLWRPDVQALDLTRKVWFRLGAAVTMLLVYGRLYEPLGFVLSTALFGTFLSRMLGAPGWRAPAFGLAAGVLGWLLCVTLMDLNLPEGAIIEGLLDALKPEVD